MPHDEGLAEVLRDDLAGEPGLSERKMFGGLCIMRQGHMLCGLYGDGGMFRVGKDNMELALAEPGTAPMSFTGRPMHGIVEAGAEVFADDDRRLRLLALSLAFVKGLPPK